MKREEKSMLSFLLIPILIAGGSLAVVKGNGNPALRIVGSVMITIAVIIVAKLAGNISDIAANVLR